MISFLCGTFSGIFTGFGVGGGLILVMLLNWMGGFSQLEAQTISLLYYIPTAIFSVWVYSKEKNVSYKIGIKFVIIGVVMAILGATIAHRIDVGILKKLFGVYLIGMGIYFLVSKARE